MTTSYKRTEDADIIQLLADEKTIINIQKESLDYKNYTLNERQLCDIELLLNGAFSPLKGYLNKKDGYLTKYAKLVTDASNGSIT